MPLNLIGYQVLRVVISRVKQGLKAKLSFGGPFKDGALLHSFGKLEQDGIVELSSFLSDEDFRSLKQRLQSLESDGHFETLVNYKESGATWVTGVIAKDTADGRWINEKVAEHPALVALIEKANGSKLTVYPRLAFQRLEVPGATIHEDDVDRTLHTDRFYSNYKAYLSIDDNDERNGAYIWCDGSHRVTAKRLIYEYQFSVKSSLHSLVGLPQRYLKNGRVDVGEYWEGALGLKERPVITEGNTLVLSNNAGFHKRGTLAPGTSRSQIRINYQYLEQGWLAKFLWATLRFAAKTGVMPRKLRARLEAKDLL